MSLALLAFAPLIFSAFIASPLMPNNPVIIRRSAKFFGVLIFAYSILFLYFFKPEYSGYQFLQSFQLPFLSAFESGCAFGLDGVSLVLVLLTNFIFLLALIASKGAVNKKHKLYYSMFFILQTAVLGVFSAKDLLLFFVFWELELIPMYILISVFGSGKKEYSAMKFLLYTFFGSLFILGAIIALVYFYSIGSGVVTFDIEQLASVKSFEYPLWAEILMFFGFFVGFAVKLPVFPLHTWLPDAHVDAPTPVSMLLAGVLLKMGAYGLIKFNLSFFPDWFDLCSSLIIILGVVNVLYAAFIAFAQTDLKKLVAYSSISHMGLVLIGLGALTIVSMSGAVFQLVAHGLVSAALFMLVGIIYKRTKTREIADLGGISQKMPVASSFALLFVLTTLGVPLLSGFVAELLVFLGAMSSDLGVFIKVFLIVGLFGMILTAGYFLVAYKKVFWGNLLPKYLHINDLTAHELLVLMCLAVSVIFFGVFPNTLLGIFEGTLDGILKLI